MMAAADDQEQQASLDKIVVVAGYGPGIGHGVSVEFLKKGFSVAVLSRFGAKKVDGLKVEQTVDIPLNQVLIKITNQMCSQLKLILEKKKVSVTQ